jgi:hypothetical protein
VSIDAWFVSSRVTLCVEISNRVCIFDVQFVVVEVFACRMSKKLQKLCQKIHIDVCVFDKVSASF